MPYVPICLCFRISILYCWTTLAVIGTDYNCHTITPTTVLIFWGIIILRYNIFEGNQILIWEQNLFEFLKRREFGWTIIGNGILPLAIWRKLNVFRKQNTHHCTLWPVLFSFIVTQWLENQNRGGFYKFMKKSFKIPKG